MQILIGWLGRGTSFLVFHSPLWLRRLLGNLLAMLWFDVFRIRRQVVLNNIARAYPEMSASDRVKLGRQSLQNMGLNFVEYSLLPWLNHENYERFFVFENPEFLDAKLKEGKGVIILTLHVGAGDLACAAMSLRGWTVALLSKEMKLKWLNDLWFGMRERLGTKFIPARNSSYTLLKTLKSGVAVIIPLDQFTGPPIGVRTTFYGHETGTAAGPAVMAERSGAPVIVVYTFRQADGRHVIRVLNEIEVQKNIDRDPDHSTKLTQKFNDELEKIVRLHPEQWMWIHKRWKRFVVQ